MGRTWERQAFLKARAAAGDASLGEEFLDELQPWIYRRYLSFADISGIKALKRRIERRAIEEGGETLDVKTGRGGIRDVEFTIQFLQLLNAGDLRELRTGATLDAIDRLSEVGCLTSQEATLLSRNYRFLRKVEHRLQMMFDLQTHLLPEDPREEQRLALRMGYDPTKPDWARQRFLADLREATEVNRKVLDHLMHDAFPDDAEAEPEVDLILEPEPTPEQIETALKKYRFADPVEAYRLLSQLATESIPFLSVRRCRHFLAAIAPELLSKLSDCPDPDGALVNLSRVSDSLGGKGALWELFSFNSASLDLYVKLCSSSPFLCGLLTSNPGMIDELLDSLLLNQLPNRQELIDQAGELCRGAEDLEPILHSFKNTQTLYVGVRDILRKDDVRRTTAALSHIGEACLPPLLAVEKAKLKSRFGKPWIEDENGGREAGFAIVGMGKFGGEELNYHSDLDVIFLYEAEGNTRRERGEGTTNQHYFGELGQRLIKTVSRLGPHGRLYEIDARLRPTGKSGLLAASLEGFAKYFTDGSGQLWERQALCKARVVYATEGFAPAVNEVIRGAVFSQPWSEQHRAEIADMRWRLEETVGPHDLKRGPGGLVDVEFLMQLLQLRHGRELPEVMRPNTLDAIDALGDAKVLHREEREFFARAYRFLRSIEARLRLMSTSARTELPDEPDELHKLALLLGYPTTEDFVEQCRDVTTEIRRRFSAKMAES